eukprot:1711-Eustigmatos_ZCMA.PRE.1
MSMPFGTYEGARRPSNGIGQCVSRISLESCRLFRHISVRDGGALWVDVGVVFHPGARAFLMLG